MLIVLILLLVPALTFAEDLKPLSVEEYKTVLGKFNSIPESKEFDVPPLDFLRFLATPPLGKVEVKMIPYKFIDQWMSEKNIKIIMQYVKSKQASSYLANSLFYRIFSSQRFPAPLPDVASTVGLQALAIVRSYQHELPYPNVTTGYLNADDQDKAAEECLQWWQDGHKRNVMHPNVK